MQEDEQKKIEIKEAVDEPAGDETMVAAGESPLLDRQWPSCDPPPASAHDLSHCIKLARDCRVNWIAMQGNDCVRQCQSCDLLVFKLDDLSPENLSKLLEDKSIAYGVGKYGTLRRKEDGSYVFNDGTPLQLYRRGDGTYMMNDCRVERTRRALPMRTVATIAACPFILAGLLELSVPGYLYQGWELLHMYWLIAGWYALGYLIACWLVSKPMNPAIRMVIVMTLLVPGIMLPVFGPALFITLAVLTLHQEPAMGILLAMQTGICLLTFTVSQIATPYRITYGKPGR